MAHAKLIVTRTDEAAKRWVLPPCDAMLLLLFAQHTKHWYYRHHRCGMDVTSLLLTQRAQVRLPVCSISCSRFFSGSPSILTQMSLSSSHICPDYLISFITWVFNVSLIGSFTWLTSPEPYSATTFRRSELISGPHTYFLTTQGHGDPPRMRD